METQNSKWLKGLLIVAALHAFAACSGPLQGREYITGKTVSGAEVKRGTVCSGGQLYQIPIYEFGLYDSYPTANRFVRTFWYAADMDTGQILNASAESEKMILVAAIGNESRIDDAYTDQDLSAGKCARPTQAAAFFKTNENIPDLQSNAAADQYLYNGCTNPPEGHVFCNVLGWETVDERRVYFNCQFFITQRTGNNPCRYTADTKIGTHLVTLYYPKGGASGDEGNFTFDVQRIEEGAAKVAQIITTIDGSYRPAHKN
ncbi:hypothetical protein [Asticcacaulis sp. W401b]|uniref:hypothetical protein n=1 Tax=Asticcacaulis sp. W401b TaxID=3388666 RepID=UPI003970BEC8